MAPQPSNLSSPKSLSSMIANYEKQLDNMLAKYPAMLKLERKIGIPKARLVAGLALAIIGYGLLHLAASMVLSLIIFAYPAFMTMKALESGIKSEHTLWLAYWVTAAAFQLFEAFSMGALAHVVPFYSVLKIVLHMWLYLPVTQGALVIYEAALRPTFKSLIGNPQFAAATEKFSSAANKLGGDLKKSADEVSKIADNLSKDD